MNEVRKERMRILNLVEEINERGIACMSFEVAGYGMALSVIRWGGIGAEEALEIVGRWDEYENHLPRLRMIRHEIEQILRGKAAAQKVEA